MGPLGDPLWPLDAPHVNPFGPLGSPGDPLGPLGAPRGNPLGPFRATGRAFGDQIGVSWAKPGAKCDPNLNQNVAQNVTKSKAEILSNLGVGFGAYVGQKHVILGCLFGCRMSFLRTT